MRLTLRTLLAYLDDILDPADKEELAHKIESSEFAEDLVHRTRDTMRRLRLSAPQVVGTGMGLDPNTVAEYLDNVLPPEQVGDYERICLESDVHLAEAAACHHVLTMVLGEPADVDPRARQRMYMIPTEARQRKRLRVEPAHVPGTQVPGTQVPGATTTVIAAAVPMALPTSAPPAATPQRAAAFEIPEYLRTRSWWRSRGALVGLAMVLVAGITLYLVSGLMGWFGSAPTMTAKSDAPRASTPPPEAVVQDSTSTPANVVAPSDMPVADAEPVTPDTQPAATGDRYAGTAEAPPLAVPPQQTASNAPNETVASPESNANENISSGGVLTINDEPTANVAPSPPTVSNAGDAAPAAVPPQSSQVEEDAARIAAVPPPDSIAAANDADPDAIAVDEPMGDPSELGTYLSGKTVLLRFDEPTGAWLRLEPRSAVVAGQQLLALPEFRPKITLVSGLLLDISGGTQVLMFAGDDVPTDAPQTVGGVTPMIDVLYGRIILINTSNSENGVRLKLGPNVADAQLARNARLAVEVEPQYVPGNDPRKTPAPAVVRLYAPDGGVVWQDATGRIAVDKSSRWTVAEGAAPAVVDEPSPPDWIDQEPVVHLSERKFGAPAVENTLVSDRPIDIQLLELFKGPDRREVKSLVARCSIHVGLFAPFIEALRDSTQRPNWKSHIETLRSAMAIGPESAERVWAALVEQRGRAAADELYEMLCGYNAEQIGLTPDEVKTGALARLIERLEEDSLDYRVLAVHNLAEVTGKRLMSNPAANAADRKINVRNWRKRLESGELDSGSQP